MDPTVAPLTLQKSVELYFFFFHHVLRGPPRLTPTTAAAPVSRVMECEGEGVRFGGAVGSCVSLRRDNVDVQALAVVHGAAAGCRRVAVVYFDVGRLSRGAAMG